MGRLRKFALFVIGSASFWAIELTARAQINAESLVEAVQAPGWHGAVKGGLSLFRGNVHLLEVRGEAALRFATSHPAQGEEDDFSFRDRILLYGNAGIKDVNHATVVNDGYAHLRYTRMQWLRFGFETYAQAQYDELRLLARRMLWGAGLRAVYLDTERWGGWLGSGYMLERERRNIPPEDRPPEGPDPVRMTNHRWSSYATLVFSIPDEKFTTVNVVYVQPRFDAFKDVQILEQLGIAFKINDLLSFTSDLYVRYDSRAPRSVKRTDVRLTQGLSLSF